MVDTTLGAKVDKLYLLKGKLTAAKKALDTSKESKLIEKLSKEYKTLYDDLLNNVPKSELDGVVGKVGMCTVEEAVVGTVTDWDQLYKFIKRTNGFDLMNKAFNNTAYRERLNVGKKVPGVKTAKIPKLSIKKRP